MSPEAMRAKVAEACGWRQHELGYWFNASDGIRICNDSGGDAQPPNYPADLNACAEMRKKLTLDQQCHYIEHLEQIIRRPENIAFGDKPTRKFRLNHFGRFAVADATAEQHCEAFLRTLGLYEDKGGAEK